MPRRKEPKIPDAILDQLLAGADAKSALEANGLLDELKKALAERALNAEMDHHVGGEGGAGNGRSLAPISFRGVPSGLSRSCLILPSTPTTWHTSCASSRMLRSSPDLTLTCSASE